MIERDLGGGGRWYVLAVKYPTASMAKRAWERAMQKLDLGAGDAGIGLYRLAPDPKDREAIPSGGDSPSVAAVTLDEKTARKAQRILSDGEEWEPTADFADAMIYRRARVVKAHEGETGRLAIRRPDGRGAQLDPFGVMHEHEPGRG